MVLAYAIFTSVNAYICFPFLTEKELLLVSLFLRNSGVKLYNSHIPVSSAKIVEAILRCHRNPTCFQSKANENSAIRD